jgi:hypothetical protein
VENSPQILKKESFLLGAILVDLEMRKQIISRLEQMSGVSEANFSQTIKDAQKQAMTHWQFLARTETDFRRLIDSGLSVYLNGDHREIHRYVSPIVVILPTHQPG